MPLAASASPGEAVRTADQRSIACFHSLRLIASRAALRPASIAAAFAAASAAAFSAAAFAAFSASSAAAFSAAACAAAASAAACAAAASAAAFATAASSVGAGSVAGASCASVLCEAIQGVVPTSATATKLATVRIARWPAVVVMKVASVVVLRCIRYS